MVYLLFNLLVLSISRLTLHPRRRSRRVCPERSTTIMFTITINIISIITIITSITIITIIIIIISSSSSSITISSSSSSSSSNSSLSSSNSSSSSSILTLVPDLLGRQRRSGARASAWEPSRGGVRLYNII